MLDLDAWNTRLEFQPTSRGLFLILSESMERRDPVISTIRRDAWNGHLNLFIFNHSHFPSFKGSGVTEQQTGRPYRFIKGQFKLHGQWQTFVYSLCQL